MAAWFVINVGIAYGLYRLIDKLEKTDTIFVLLSAVMFCASALIGHKSMKTGIVLYWFAAGLITSVYMWRALGFK